MRQWHNVHFDRVACCWVKGSWDLCSLDTWKLLAEGSSKLHEMASRIPRVEVEARIGLWDTPFFYLGRASLWCDSSIYPIFLGRSDGNIDIGMLSSLFMNIRHDSRLWPVVGHFKIFCFFLMWEDCFFSLLFGRWRVWVIDYTGKKQVKLQLQICWNYFSIGHQFPPSLPASFPPFFLSFLLFFLLQVPVEFSVSWTMFGSMSQTEGAWKWCKWT